MSDYSSDAPAGPEARCNKDKHEFIYVMVQGGWMATIKTIPIFTLDLVLFPRQELQLRVFEPRYKQLVDDCMLGDRQFGVCLIKEGGSVLGWSMPHNIGTLAKIVRCEDVGLDGMQLRIETMGRNPFRIRRLIDPSIPQPSDYDPMSEEGHRSVHEANDAAGSGGKMYIRAEVEILQEIDGTVPLAAWENLVFLWKKKVGARAKPGEMPPSALDEMLKRFYLVTETPTTEYVYSLCALGSSVPSELQHILESTSIDELLVRATSLMDAA